MKIKSHYVNQVLGRVITEQNPCGHGVIATWIVFELWGFVDSNFDYQ